MDINQKDFLDQLASLKSNNNEEVSLILDSLAIIGHSSGYTNESYAGKMAELIINLIRKSDYHDAVKAQSKYIVLFENDEQNTSVYATSAFFMAYSSGFINDYENEVKYYNQTISIYGQDHPAAPTFNNNLGLAHQNLGNYEEALSYFSNAIEKTKTKDKITDDFATRLMNLAFCYTSLGEYTKAEQYYFDSLKIWDSLDKDHDDYGKLLNNIGKLYRETGDHVKAKNLFKTALDNFLENFDESHDRYGYILNDYASILLISGDEEEAIRLMENNLKIAEDNKITNTVDYFKRQYNLAKAYNVMERFNEALPLLQNATQNIERFYGRDHPEYGTILKSLGDTYLGLGRINEAVAIMESSNKVLLEQINQVFRFRSENEKKAFLAKLSRNFDDLQSIALSPGIESNELNELNLNNQLLLKGLLLNNSRGVLTELAKVNETEIQDKIITYRSLKNDLNTELSLPILEREKDVDSLKDIINSLEVELVKLHSDRFPGNNNLARNWKSSQERLKKNEYAIEFTHFNRIEKGKPTGQIMYVAYIYEAESEFPVLVPLFEEQKLNDLIAKKSPNELYRSQELYKMIWQPVAKAVPTNKRVYYSPSGLLSQISFAAIAYQDKLLINEYDLVQLSSTSVLTEDAATPQIDTAMLLGGIEYDYKITPESEKHFASHSYLNNESIAKSRGTKSRGESWTFLEATLSEINAINGLLEQSSDDVVSLTSKDATEEAFKKLSGNSPQLLHIATHGFFFENLNEDSSFSLDLTTEDRYRLAKDPLLRSGLILSGANYAWKYGGNPPSENEDGILSAMEIANLDLSNTDLVVLSACETGLGDIDGSEGVYGLQRAFKMAGVDKMILSLWKVPDEETAEFMQKFYGNWLEDGAIRDAFIKTQREMSNK
ncbi:MAG: CHAT domain-containing protein, partial [Flavobacteriaceae bacterium]|nr:CHAT domain-containing protein [Bacteroidia bacterium]NNL61584.1 CHAT domain-containing protein [Flavobacteriaceae bacterium]